MFLLIVFISIMNALAFMFSWYWRVPWLDMPMHFLGGLWVGSVALWFYSQSIRGKLYSIFFVSIGAVLIVGGLWEMFEFSADSLISFSEQNKAIDTASDIMFDIIGGITSAVYFILKK